jgi:AraC family transcriptional regulator
MQELAFQDITAPAAAPPTVVSSEFLAVLNGLLAEAKAEAPRERSLTVGWLDRFESILAQAHSPSTLDASATPRTGGLAPWQVSRVKRYIETHLSQRLNVSELAALVHLSDSHFARASKTSLGCSPHAYVIQQRIEFAKRLVLETDLPLSQVALESGLADQAHLSRLYRRFFGATPSASRRHNSSPASAVEQATL